MHHRPADRQRIGGNTQMRGVAGIVDDQRRSPPAERLDLEGIYPLPGKEMSSTGAEAVATVQVGPVRICDRGSRAPHQLEDGGDDGTQ